MNGFITLTNTYGLKYTFKVSLVSGWKENTVHTQYGQTYVVFVDGEKEYDFPKSEIQRLARALNTSVN